MIFLRRTILATAMTLACGGAAADDALGSAGGAPIHSAPIHSEAIRIARLHRNLQSDSERYQSLEQDLERVRAAYRQAEMEFVELDKQRAELQAVLKEVRESGDAEAVAREEATLEELNAKWKLSKERFELAIQERQAVEEKLASLATRISSDQNNLDALRQGGANNSAAAPPQTGSPSSAPAAGVLNAEEAAAASPTRGAEKPISPELQQAERQAEQAAEAARRASQDAMSAADRMEALRREIDLAHKLNATARQKVDNAQQALLAAQDAYQKRSKEGAGADELAALYDAIDQTQQRFIDAQREVRQRGDELNERQAELSSLQVENLAAAREADQKRREAEAAEKRVATLKNPFTMANINRFFAEHGVRLSFILLAMLLVRWVFKLLSRRAAHKMTRDSGDGADDQERNARETALVGFLLRVATFVIAVTGGILILAELNVPILPLWTMVSAILAMVAIGFVAVWSVLSNTLCSVILLIYQPFCVGNTVELTSTDVSGRVVNFNMLFTTLRGENGDLIEIPNNTFFQQPIRRRIGRASVSLDEQLLKTENTE